MITQYEFHEVANQFPLMTENEFQELVKDIKENGQSEPIKIYQNKIIDGRNRYKACLELDIEPKTQEWDGEGSLIAKVVSLNLKRHQYTDKELIKVGLSLKPLYEEEAKERQATSTGGINPQLVCERTEADKGRTNDILGEMLGVSGDKIKRGSKIYNDGTPELIDTFENTDISIRAAYEVARLPKESQPAAVEEIKQGVKRDRQTKSEKEDLEKKNNEWIKNNKPKELSQDDIELKELVDNALKTLTESLKNIEHKTDSMSEKKNIYQVLRPLLVGTEKYLNDIEVIIKLRSV